MLGLHCCARALSSYGEWGLLCSSLVWCVGFSLQGLLGAEQRLQRTRASAAAACGLQREGRVVEACGIFPDQASKSCPLHSKRILNHWTTTEIRYDVLSSVQFRSVTQSCPTLCDPMNCSIPGFSVLHCLPEFAQTHAWVTDVIQPSHPLSLPSPPNLSLSQHPASGSFPMNRLFASGGQSIGASASASVLPMSIRGWFPLGLTGLISLLSKGLSRVFSSTTLRKRQFFGIQPSLWSNSHLLHWGWSKLEYD